MSSRTKTMNTSMRLPNPVGTTALLFRRATIVTTVISRMAASQRKTTCFVIDMSNVMPATVNGGRCGSSMC